MSSQATLGNGMTVAQLDAFLTSLRGGILDALRQGVPVLISRSEHFQDDGRHWLGATIRFAIGASAVSMAPMPAPEPAGPTPAGPAIPEPTSDQCCARERVYEDAERVGFALWYPQMGGYAGRAVALFDKAQDPARGIGGCVDVLVWHDGQFPFDGEDGERLPRRIHHCDPHQFIEFGEILVELNERARRGSGDEPPP